MDKFIASLETQLRMNAPELLGLFTTIAAEARFAYALLAEDLARLAPGTRVLEVGGGTMLLSCQLAADGFAVTAVEPTGEGFGAFDKLRTFILAHALIKPAIVTCGIEEFTSDAGFDFAFSINVMEHVKDWRLAIRQVGLVLKPGASYRFVCANYLFPYEPHFNIPIVYSKALTARLFAKKIRNAAMQDAAGVWQSLNWISVPAVRRAMTHEPSLRLRFNRRTMIGMLERALVDSAFASRRSRWMVAIIRILVAVRLHRLIGLVPAMFQPLMDVTLTKNLRQ